MNVVSSPLLIFLFLIINFMVSALMPSIPAAFPFFFFLIITCLFHINKNQYQITIVLLWKYLINLILDSRKKITQNIYCVNLRWTKSSVLLLWPQKAANSRRLQPPNFIFCSRIFCNSGVSFAKGQDNTEKKKNWRTQCSSFCLRFNSSK